MGSFTLSLIHHKREQRVDMVGEAKVNPLKLSLEFCSSLNTKEIIYPLLAE